MPVLENSRHELFAQAIASGQSQGGAYVIAGYKPNHSNAAQLAQRSEIAARITEINQRGALRAEVTVESICRELEEARCLALITKQTSSMVAASMGKAKIARLLEDVTKHIGADGGPIKHSIEVRFVDSEYSDEP